jgi:hypothetical protein
MTVNLSSFPFQAPFIGQVRQPLLYVVQTSMTAIYEMGLAALNHEASTYHY